MGQGATHANRSIIKSVQKITTLYLLRKAYPNIIESQDDQLILIERHFRNIMSKGITLRGNNFKVADPNLDISKNIFVVSSAIMTLFQYDLLNDLDKLDLVRLLETTADNAPLENKNQTESKYFRDAFSSDNPIILTYIPSLFTTRFTDETHYQFNFNEVQVENLLDELSEIAVLQFQPSTRPADLIERPNPSNFIAKNFDMKYLDDNLGYNRLQNGEFYLYYANHKVRQFQLRFAKTTIKGRFLFAAQLERKYNTSPKINCRIREILQELEKLGFVILEKKYEDFFELGLSSFRFLIFMEPKKASKFITARLVEDEARRIRARRLMEIQKHDLLAIQDHQSRESRITEMSHHC